MRDLQVPMVSTVVGKEKFSVNVLTDFVSSGTDRKSKVAVFISDM